jgi:hypothetical protein
MAGKLPRVATILGVFEVASTAVRSAGQLAISLSITKRSALMEARIGITEVESDKTTVSYPCN